MTPEQLLERLADIVKAEDLPPSRCLAAMLTQRLTAALAMRNHADAEVERQLERIEAEARAFGRNRARSTVHADPGADLWNQLADDLKRRRHGDR